MNEATPSAIMDLISAIGSNAKKQVLLDNKDNEEFKAFLRYALDPLKTYKMSNVSTTYAISNRAEETSFNDIFDVCEFFSSKKAATREDIMNVGAFLWSTPEKERDLYIKLLTKTLRLGVTGQTVNKVFKGLIPEWEVQQAYPIDKYPIKNGTWFALTQKLNGVRATFFNGKLYARTGQEYRGLDHIIDEIKRSVADGIVLDGELTLKKSYRSGMSDNEAFRAATGIINSDSDDKTCICYTVFDCLPDEEFIEGESKLTYIQRRVKLGEIEADLFLSYLYNVCADGEDRNVEVLPLLYEGIDQSKIPDYLDKMVAEDKEGLMVNLNTTYKCRRHNGILKVKRFYTMDLPIIGVEEGTGRLIGTLGSFVLDYKGNEVRVGSGFSDDQRNDFWENKESVVGKLCEVKYKEVSYDKKTGEESLQFPTFVTIREDKTRVSYG